ncbi:MAG: ATP-binding cassette domain-containing protein [Planctomycetota bacterium]
MTTLGLAVTFENATVSFGDVTALDNISLEPKPGATTAIIGPSGCGKSTLLRLVIGLLTPTSGRVLIDGKDLASTDLTELRRRTGFVLQDGGLFPHLTAASNATLLPRRLGWPIERLKARLDELAELTRLPADALARYPAELSGGQRQRVAVIRALFLDPPLLLLDEPLGALDPLVRHGMQADLRSIFAELNKTVLLVTHDLAEAAYLAEDVVLMKDGDVVQHAPPSELVRKPANDFVRDFVTAQRSHMEAIT